MPVNIIHKDGVYNFYDTRSDGAWFESGLTLEQLTKFYEKEYGSHRLAELPERLERAHARGTSCRITESLEYGLSCNRAGPGETRMSVEDFIAKFLTINPDEAEG